jgi:hypothetical protein
MFAEDSRYAQQKIINVTLKNGETVSAVKLRKLKVLKGKPYEVKQNERLDLLAYKQYKSPQRFWYIADANTELDAGDLVKEIKRNILLPEI